MRTHWKKLRNPLYLGAYDFDQNEERTVTIEKVIIEDVKGPDGKSEQCTVVYLKDSKPFICNATNAKAISKAIGSPYIEDWQNKPITLFTQKIRAFGEVVDALRCKAAKPKQLPSLNQERFDKAIEAIKSGSYSVEKLKAEYSLTKEQSDAVQQL